MNIQLKTIFGEIILEGDFSCLADCVKAALAAKKSLSSANLRYANLSSANLSYANLSYANLSSANLSYANLSSANLSSANLSYANLSSANLRSANLSSANLSYVFKALPELKNPDALILAAIKDGGTLDMSTWHRCATTHCRAGWYIHLSGPAGAMLEAVYGPSAAGAIIFTKAYPTEKVPDFVATNDDALADIRRCAALGDKANVAVR